MGYVAATHRQRVRGLQSCIMVPQCEKHATLSETPVGCRMCVLARQAWVEAAQSMAEKQFEASKVHATEQARQLREAWWDDVWAAGNPQRIEQLARMRESEAEARKQAYERNLKASNRLT